MTGRNERDRRLSAEGEGRLGLEDLVEPIRQGDDAGGHPRGNGNPPTGWAEAGEPAKACKEDRDSEGGGPDVHCGGDGEEGGGVSEFPDTHDLADSVGLSLLMMGMFVLTTVAMYEQLPGRAYLVWGGMGYAMGFGTGFLVALQATATEVARWRRGAGFECRMAVFLIAGGLLFGGLVGGDAETWAEWKAPLVWVPGILWLAICVGGAIDGALLGEVARGLPRRTPWHALRLIVSERRRAAAARERQETKP